MQQIYATYDWKQNQGTGHFKYCPACGTRLTLKQIAQKTRPLCPSCGFVCYRNPLPTVSILVAHDGQILLGKRLEEPGRGKWALPSGYIEFEDDFVTAATREVREETGLEIEIISILNVQSAFLPPEYHFLGIFLLAQVTGGSLHPGDDLEDVRWFSLSAALPEMAFPPDVQLIQAYSGGNLQGIRIKKHLNTEST